MRELTREEKKKLQAMINTHREEQDEKRQVYQVEHRRAVYQQKHALGSESRAFGRSHPHRSMYHLGVEQELKQLGRKRQKSRRRSMKLKWMRLTRRQKDDLKSRIQDTARKRHKT
jgi:hypothetical protein